MSPNAALARVPSSAVMPRLDRGIQYAAAPRLNHNRLGILDRPVKPGDDTECVGTAPQTSRNCLTLRRFSRSS
jgi:hypothetical protein